MASHIFIINTPFQLRIAVKIIELCEKEDDFHAIYLKTNKIVKSGTKQELIDIFNSFLITRQNYDIVNLIKIHRFIKKINNKNIETYLANVNELTTQYIVSMISKTGIIIKTFDDGILNINSLEEIDKLDSLIKVKKSIRYNLSKLFFKKPYNSVKIIKESSLHFTILSENKKINVNSNIIKISIFDTESDREINPENNEIKNIFIGSRFKDILKTKTPENLEKLTNKINKLSTIYSDLIYLRHPRESLESSLNMFEQHLDSISEDYIFALSEKNVTLNVIGFGSTCQLNIMNLKNINIVLLKTVLIKDDILDSYSLFNTKNTSVLNIG